MQWPTFDGYGIVSIRVVYFFSRVLFSLLRLVLSSIFRLVFTGILWDQSMGICFLLWHEWKDYPMGAFTKRMAMA